MFMGVPYVPFVVGAGSCLLLAMYVNLFCLLALPAVILVLRGMARYDDRIFHLLGLYLGMRVRIRNAAQHDGLWVFSPVGPRKPTGRSS